MSLCVGDVCVSVLVMFVSLCVGDVCVSVLVMLCLCVGDVVSLCW